MFQRYELERLLYVHPTFLALWNADVLSTARYILQSQVVSHILKNVGLVVVVTRVVSVKPGNFDPSDGGIYARVRFQCYATNPVKNSLAKGRVESVNSEGLLVRMIAGLPVHIPRTFLPRDTTFHHEKNTFIWTKKLKTGSSKYFEIKQGDEIKFKVDDVSFDGHTPIHLFDGSLEKCPMRITGDIRTFSLGPVHWYTMTGSTAEGGSDGEKGPGRTPSLKEVGSQIVSHSDDAAAFLQEVRRQAGC